MGDLKKFEKAVWRSMLDIDTVKDKPKMLTDSDFTREKIMEIFKDK